MQTALRRLQDTAIGELTNATSEGDVEAVKGLVARGVPLNAGGYDGQTTMHLAVAKGEIEIVQVLLQKGAMVCIHFCHCACLVHLSAW